jgi:hypothetical protein
MSFIRFKVLWLACALFLHSATAEAKPREVKMNRALQRKLNTFMSNFSEGYVRPFARGKISDEQLVNFALHHEWCNRKRNLSAPVPAVRVERLAMYYFGAKVKRHGSLAGSTYKSGQYHHTISDGDPMPFAQISRLVDMGNGEFVVYTNEYETHDADPQGNYSPEKNAHTNVWEGARFTGKRKGTIKQVGSGARRRYILLDYKVLSTIHEELR